MPIFEYHCADCDESCELLVRGSEKPVCPHCESRRLEKLISAPARPAGLRVLPMGGSCPPADAPLCSPRCCRAPQ